MFLLGSIVGYLRGWRRCCWLRRAVVHEVAEGAGGVVPLGFQAGEDAGHGYGLPPGHDGSAMAATDP